jgi:hypothetical protein
LIDAGAPESTPLTESRNSTAEVQFASGTSSVATFPAVTEREPPPIFVAFGARCTYVMPVFISRASDVMASAGSVKSNRRGGM